MLAFIQKLSYQYVVDNLSPELVALVVVAFFVSAFTWKANTIHTGNKKRDEQAAIDAKQQRKTEQLICAMPCISKENATWLQDVTLNGGKPPKDVDCPGPGNKQ